MPPPPWDQLPGESSEDFGRFAAWLHDPKAAAPVGLSARWRWRARRDAYRYHLHRERTLAAVEEAHAQGQAHAQVLDSLLDWAMESMSARRADGEILSPREIAAAGKMAIDLQRLRAGEPGAIVRTDLSGASDESLATALAALEALGVEST